VARAAVAGTDALGVVALATSDTAAASSVEVAGTVNGSGKLLGM